MKPKKVIKFLRCELTQEEHRQAALNLARANEAMAQIDEEKKVATSQFGERIAQAKASIGKYSRVISNGYEMRNVECRVLYHCGVEDAIQEPPGWVIIKEVPQAKTILRNDLIPAGCLNPDLINPGSPIMDARGSVHYPKLAIVAVEAMSEAELQESFDFDQQQAQPTTPVAAVPVCSICGAESAKGDPCDSCQADQKVNGKRAKKTGKARRDSASRVVSTPADQQPGEEF